MSEIQAATTNAATKPQGDLTPDFLAPSTNCATAKVHALSHASSKYSQSHPSKLIQRTMTVPTLNSNVRSNTFSITVIISTTKLWPSVVLRSDLAQ